MRACARVCVCVLVRVCVCASVCLSWPRRYGLVDVEPAAANIEVADATGSCAVHCHAPRVLFDAPHYLCNDGALLYNKHGREWVRPFVRTNASVSYRPSRCECMPCVICGDSCLSRGVLHAPRAAVL